MPIPRFSLTALFAALACLSASAQSSTITVHVYKTGLLSAMGHNHIVVAPVARASVDSVHMSVEIVVHAKEMKVADPEVSDSTRADIQKEMLSPKVLDPDKFPEIHFKSSRIESAGDKRFRVTGMLDLHGVSKEISFEVSGDPSHYHGSTKLKQTDFQIEPVSAGGGTVKVKDQIDLDFEIYGEGK